MPFSLCTLGGDSGPQDARRPIYSILVQFGYKQGVRINPDVVKPDQVKPPEYVDIGRHLLREFLAAGLVPRSYAETYWSSDYTGWWVFDTWDLETFRETVKKLRYDHNLETWLDIKFTIGKAYSLPLYQLSTTKGDKPEDMVVASDGKDKVDITASVLDYRDDGELTVRETDDKTIMEVKVTGTGLLHIRNGSGGWEKAAMNQTKLIASKGAVTFRLTASEPGQAQVLVAVADPLREYYQPQDTNLWGTVILVKTT